MTDQNTDGSQDLHKQFDSRFRGFFLDEKVSPSLPTLPPQINQLENEYEAERLNDSDNEYSHEIGDSNLL